MTNVNSTGLFISIWVGSAGTGNPVTAAWATGAMLPEVSPGSVTGAMVNAALASAATAVVAQVRRKVCGQSIRFIIFAPLLGTDRLHQPRRHLARQARGIHRALRLHPGLQRVFEHVATTPIRRFQR